MTGDLGITQWNVPWKREELCIRAEKLGMTSLHLELGSADEGYPMIRPENREAWLESTETHHLRIVSLALNDLCGHGFTAGIGDPHSEIALATLKYGVETAAAMGIPSISVPHFFANRITDDESFRASAEALQLLCNLAGDKGILIHTENVLNHTELTRLWNEVDRDNLRLLFDSQNYSAMAGTDASEIFVKWRTYCGDYLHFKDGITPELGNRPLWQGTSSFEETFSTVLKSGYSGAMILESNYADEAELEKDLKKIRKRLI